MNGSDFSYTASGEWMRYRRTARDAKDGLNTDFLQALEEVLANKNLRHFIRL